MSIEGDGFAARFHAGVAFNDDAFMAIRLPAQAAIADACNALACDA